MRCLSGRRSPLTQTAQRFFPSAPRSSGPRQASPGTGFSAVWRAVGQCGQGDGRHERVEWVQPIAFEKFAVADLGHPAGAGKVAVQGLASALRSLAVSMPRISLAISPLLAPSASASRRRR